MRKGSDEIDVVHHRREAVIGDNRNHQLGLGLARVGNQLADTVVELLQCGDASAEPGPETCST